MKLSLPRIVHSAGKSCAVWLEWAAWRIASGQGLKHKLMGGVLRWSLYVMAVVTALWVLSWGPLAVLLFTALLATGSAFVAKQAGSSGIKAVLGVMLLMLVLFSLGGFVQALSGLMDLWILFLILILIGGLSSARKPEERKP